MGRTKKDLVTDPIHRKAGPHKEKKKEPKVCPECKGDYYSFADEICSRCKNEGVVYE